MNLEVELILMEAVRTRLMERLEFNADQVDFEIDEEAPAMTGDFYCSIRPIDGRIGRFQNNMETQHFQYGIRVVCHERISDVGRDRRKRIAYERHRSISSKLTTIYKALTGDYDLMSSVNAELERDDICGKFIKPLLPKSIDTAPKMRASDLYGGKKLNQGDPIVSITRGINFGGAEFMGNQE